MSAKAEMLLGNTIQDETAKLRWRMLLLTILCYLFYYTGRQNFSFAILGMQNDLGLSTAHTGFISGMLLLFYGLGQVASGYLGDRYSPKSIIFLGAILSILLNYFVSLSSTFYPILLFWCVNGLAQSMGFAPGSKLIANWWPKEKRSLAMGLFLCSTSGSSVVTFSLCLLVLKYFNWPWVFRLPLIPFFFVTLLFYLLVKDTPDSNSRNSRSEKASRENFPKEFPWGSLMTKRYLLACLSMGFCSLARYGLIIWVPVYYLKMSDLEGVHSWVSLALPFGMALGSVSAGFVTDRFYSDHKSRVVLKFMLLSSLLVYLIMKTPDHFILLNLSLLFFSGFFIYGSQTPLFSICPDIVCDEVVGSAIGVMNAVGYVFASFGEFLIGYLIHKNGDQFQFMFFVVIASSVLAAIFSLGVKSDFK